MGERCEGGRSSSDFRGSRSLVVGAGFKPAPTVFPSFRVMPGESIQLDYVLDSSGPAKKEIAIGVLGEAPGDK